LLNRAVILKNPFLGEINFLKNFQTLLFFWKKYLFFFTNFFFFNFFKLENNFLFLLKVVNIFFFKDFIINSIE
jgi:hypothetical protein